MGRLCEERRKKGRRAHLRWEDYVKRDVRKEERKKTTSMMGRLCDDGKIV